VLLGEIVPQCFDLDRAAAVSFGPQQPDHFAEQSDRSSEESDLVEQGANRRSELVNVGLICAHELGEGGAGVHRSVVTARNRRVDCAALRRERGFERSLVRRGRDDDRAPPPRANEP